MIEELKRKIEDFEAHHSEVEKESKARVKEAEEAQQKVVQLQDRVER